MLEFVRENRATGDVYLIPVRVFSTPKPRSGSKSSDFQPVTAKQGDKQIIPVDLQRFRLYTGAPIFVDFKSIPYKDVEVLEWKRRLDWTERVHAKGDWNAAELRQKGITHVVTTTDRDDPPSQPAP